MVWGKCIKGGPGPIGGGGGGSGWVLTKNLTYCKNAKKSREGGGVGRSGWWWGSGWL